MGSSVSTSQSSNPLSDIKPTLENSPTDFFINRSNTNTGSNVAESLLGDVVTRGNNEKINSTFGPALNRSNLTMNLSGGSSITDGGAIMAMFNLASESIKANQGATSLLAGQQAAAVKQAEESNNDLSKMWEDVKSFLSENKSLMMLGGLFVGYLLYKGVTK